MEKVLTISVAAYNAAGDLPRCLDSMLQTEVADKLEIIVVNDGSKDDTADVARNYVNQYPDIVKLVDKENGGHGSTINASIPLATGRYYKIVDSDDWVDKKGMEDLVAALETAEADLVLNPYYIMKPGHFDAPVWATPFQKAPQYGKQYAVEDIADIDIAMHAFTYKTDIVQKMGPVISEHCFYVDMEYTLFPFAYVKSYLCLNFPVYCYLLGTATQSMNMNNMIRRRDQHLHVTKRLVQHVRGHGEELAPAVRELVDKRVRLAIVDQFRIYFCMEPKESLPEVKEFDQWLKETSPEMYDKAEGALGKQIQLMRRLGFRGYGLIVSIWQVWHNMRTKQ